MHFQIHLLKNMCFVDALLSPFMVAAIRRSFHFTCTFPVCTRTFARASTSNFHVTAIFPSLPPSTTTSTIASRLAPRLAPNHNTAMSSTTDEHQKVDMDSPCNDSVFDSKEAENAAPLNKPDENMLPPPSPAKKTNDDKNLEESAKKLAALRLKRAVQRQTNVNLASTMMRPVEGSEKNANPKLLAPETAPASESESGFLGSVYPKTVQGRETTSSKRFEEWLADGRNVRENDKPKVAAEKPETAPAPAPESGFLRSVYPKTEQGQESTTSEWFEEWLAKGGNVKKSDNPELTIKTLETTPKPESASSASTNTSQYPATPKRLTTKITPEEAITPRLNIYIKLHNDVSFPTSTLSHLTH